MENDTIDTIALSQKIRAHTLRMVFEAKASHVGTCLSTADILAVLYEEVLNIDPKSPEWPKRDRFILSKGHGAAILYAVLAEKGFFPTMWLDGYCQEGSLLIGHVSHKVPGVELSTGSLGHGLPVACGMALAAKQGNENYRIFTILSDGELDEGSNWEAIMFASHHKLDNLIAIVDYNKLQGFGYTQEVLNLEPIKNKWESFGWVVKEIDGHNHQQIKEVLKQVPFEANKPSVVIAETVKGKGVSFMENRLEWHYKSPNTQQLQEALKEIGGHV